MNVLTNTLLINNLNVLYNFYLKYILTNPIIKSHTNSFNKIKYFNYKIFIFINKENIQYIEIRYNKNYIVTIFIKHEIYSLDVYSNEIDCINFIINKLIYFHKLIVDKLILDNLFMFEKFLTDEFTEYELNLIKNNL